MRLALIRSSSLALAVLIGASAYAVDRVAPGDPVARVLAKLHHDPKAGFRDAESAYRSAKTDQVAARLATVLAFAPAEAVATAPYQYAQFAFLNDRTLTRELKVKLAKLAGEGLFNNSQFAKAASVFERALRIESLSRDEKEYFHYQLAWCDLNRKNPEGAVRRLTEWTKNCPECRLHKEMITDLGKAFASSNAAAGDVLAALPSDAERDAFIDGYVAEIHRAPKTKLYLSTERFLQTPLLATWLRFAFEDKRLEEHSACARIDALAKAPPESWPKERARHDFRACSLTQLKGKKPIPGILRAGYEQLPDPTQLDLLLLSSLQEREGALALACTLRLKAVNLPLEESAREALKPEVILPALLPACRANAADSAGEIADLFSKPALEATLGADASKWFNHYVSEVVGVDAWRAAFETKPLNETLARADGATLKRLILDSRWSRAWRKSLWTESPDAGALDPAVLFALAKEAHATPAEYSALVKEIESRAKSPRALIALLKAREPGRTVDAKTAYEEAKAIPDWQELSVPERQELLEGVLQGENVERVISDWPTWKPLLETDPFAFQKFLGLFIAAGAPRAPEGDSAHEMLLAKLKERRENVSVEIPTRGLPRPATADAAILNQAIKTHSALRALTAKSGLNEVERALDLSQKTFSKSRKHKWKIGGLAELHRADLKASLAHARSELEKAEGLEAETYRQLAQVVADWEKKL